MTILNITNNNTFFMIDNTMECDGKFEPPTDASNTNETFLFNTFSKLFRF